MSHPTIRRFERAVRHLRAEKKDLKQDTRELREDRNQLATARATEKKQLASIAQQREQLADTFEPTDPMLAEKLKALDVQQKKVETTADRVIARETKQIAQNRRQIVDGKKDVTAARRLAFKRLRPAELHTNSLRETNQLRRMVGLKRVKQQIISTRTVAGCARALLQSKNVSFWSGLSTGSDRKKLVALAKGGKAYVDATGARIKPKLKMMQALVAMSKHGRIMINALTGGSHSTNSNHYRGTAVDLDLSTGNAGMIERIANKYGGRRNFETTHIHLDF